jgi:hypothetical protein
VQAVGNSDCLERCLMEFSATFIDDRVVRRPEQVWVGNSDRRQLPGVGLVNWFLVRCFPAPGSVNQGPGNPVPPSSPLIEGVLKMPSHTCTGFGHVSAFLPIRRSPGRALPVRPSMAPGSAVFGTCRFLSSIYEITRLPQILPNSLCIFQVGCHGLPEATARP